MGTIRGTQTATKKLLSWVKTLTFSEEEQRRFALTVQKEHTPDIWQADVGEYLLEKDEELGLCVEELVDEIVHDAINFMLSLVHDEKRRFVVKIHNRDVAFTLALDIRHEPSWDDEEYEEVFDDVPSDLSPLRKAYAIWQESLWAHAEPSVQKKLKKNFEMLLFEVDG